MRRYIAFGLAALLSTATAPAWGDWNHIGTVTFSMGNNHFSTQADFRGDRVALTSRAGDVYCRDVEAVFGNGRMRSIFRGMLRANSTVNIDLPGDVRRVQQLDFDCQPTDGSLASVDVAANTVDRGGQRFGYGYGRPFDLDGQLVGADR